MPQVLLLPRGYFSGPYSLNTSFKITPQNDATGLTLTSWILQWTTLTEHVSLCTVKSLLRMMPQVLLLPRGYFSGPHSLNTSFYAR